MADDAEAQPPLPMTGNAKRLPRKREEASESRWDDPWGATPETREQIYTRENFLTDLAIVSQQITDEINRDPKEVARLRKARQQAREGKRRPVRRATKSS
jgi:hypothetical protein